MMSFHFCQQLFDPLAAAGKARQAACSVLQHAATPQDEGPHSQLVVLAAPVTGL